MKNLLTFILPTNDKQSMFGTLLPSLKNIGELKNIAHFSIVFQPPYNENDIKRVIDTFESLGIDYSYLYKEYQYDDNKIPLIRMRQDCALQNPASKFYAFLDDDMEFLPGIDEQYIDALYLLLTDNNYSVFCINLSELNTEQVPYDISIVNSFETHFGTGAGLIFRGGYWWGFSGAFAPDICKLWGGLDDELCVLLNLLPGYFAAQCTNGRCNHFIDPTDPNKFYKNTDLGSTLHLLNTLQTQQKYISLRLQKINADTQKINLHKKSLYKQHIQIKHSLEIKLKLIKENLYE